MTTVMVLFAVVGLMAGAYLRGRRDEARAKARQMALQTLKDRLRRGDGPSTYRPF